MILSWSHKIFVSWYTRKEWFIHSKHFVVVTHRFSFHEQLKISAFQK
jgi:hypothetical protein